MTHLAIRNLTMRYRGQDEAAISDLTIDVESGSLVALLGPSGCGKTTTMKMIAGLLTPTSGDILFDDQSMLSIAPEKRSAVMVFQNHLLFPYMSIADNVGYGLKIRKLDRATVEKKVKEILDLVQLPGLDNRMPNELSGGQQQRVALARALVVSPKLLLLDEPLSNLDAHLRFEMRDLIRGIQQKMGTTMVFVTHDQEEAVVLADKVALIFGGKLQQYDKPIAFYEQPRSRRIAVFFGGVNFFPGRQADKNFKCNFGDFSAPRTQISDGNAILNIRPEDVRLSSKEESNTFGGRIVSQVYVGTHSRMQVEANGHHVHLVTDADIVKRYQPGDNITLCFPEDKLWVLPPEAS